MVSRCFVTDERVLPNGTSTARQDCQTSSRALSDKRGFLTAARSNPKLAATDIPKIAEQLEHLQAADVIVLDEIDDGVARINCENVPRELASALHMNYVFGVEFIELNGVFLHQKKMSTTGASAEDSQTFGDDPSKDRGMEGTAMLSRYPMLCSRSVAQAK